jgi:hypothetical protein
MIKDGGLCSRKTGKKAIISPTWPRVPLQTLAPVSLHARPSFYVCALFLSPAPFLKISRACVEGNLRIVSKILEMGADPNARDDDWWTPLHAAASAGVPPLLTAAAASLARRRS